MRRALSFKAEASVPVQPTGEWNSLRLDLLYDVDVMIFGAPSGAVAAALAAKKAGATVLAVSDRSYFGEETAGAMRLWPRVCSDHPLFIAAFGTGAAVGPPTPLRIKRVLDQALLEAEVPVLCDCRPAFLLQGEKGELAGAVLAYRTQLCAVRAKVLVDCSHTGLLVRLAELPIAERPVGADRQLVVLGAAPPADRQGHWQEAPMPLSLHTAQGEKVYQAYILRVPPGSPLCAFGQAGAEACSAGASASWVTAALEREFLDRRRLHYPGILYSADTFYDPMLVGLAVQEEATDDFCSLPDEALSHCQGRLMVANGLLPLTAAAAAELDEFANQLALGERAGRLAAVAAAGLKTVSGPYSCSSASTGAGEQSGEPESPAGAGKRELRFDKFFRREPGPHAGGDMELEVEIGDIPLLAEADVVVAGGGTSGAAAGIAAA
ncbi:MAG TPA: FAD-dependent oxidoreductase, partial [Firmicutes bacterium]|nr:FAD-dependent oxidoreductase [Bacillota bacterium]